MEVRYRELALDEKLQPEDQYSPRDDEEYWRLITLDSIGFTPRRFAAFGTRWRRPYFPCDKEFDLLPTESQVRVGGWLETVN
jgi:hypothetical protein